MSKELFQLYVDPDLKEYVKNKAEEKKISRASFVRELIEKEKELEAHYESIKGK